MSSLSKSWKRNPKGIPLKKKRKRGERDRRSVQRKKRQKEKYKIDKKCMATSDL